MSVRRRPGAEPFRFDGGPAGALVLHGFTGSPASTRPLGEFLAARGLSVIVPCLAGHGGTTSDLARARWRDWERDSQVALADLSSRCRSVTVVGLSFGAALALHLAATRPDSVRGLVLINPFVHDRRVAAAPALRFLVPSIKSIGNDIKKPGQDEVCNDRIPLGTLASVSVFLRSVRRELSRVRAPLLVLSSADDHTVKPANSAFVMEHAGSDRKAMVRLTNSFHVATLDYDANVIFERTLEFVNKLAPQHE